MKSQSRKKKTQRFREEEWRRFATDLHIKDTHSPQGITERADGEERSESVMSTANVIWLDSLVEIITVKWSSSGAFLRRETNTCFIGTLVFPCIYCACVFWHLRLDPTSEPGGAGGSLTRSFSDPYLFPKWGVQRSAVSHRRLRPNIQGSLFKTRAAVNAPETPNLTALRRINCSTLQMITVTKREERHSAEQLKVWPSSDHQSSIKLMVWNLTNTGAAVGCAVSHPGDL